MFLTFIKLPFVIKIFVLSIFEWPFYAGFTVFVKLTFKAPITTAADDKFCDILLALTKIRYDIS